MKKIPTLFERDFKNGKVVGITDKVYPGMEWVLEGKGEATVKWDGSCCAIIDGKFYRRYDAKKGRKPPEGAIPCCDPDPVTGHHPHWVLIDKDDPQNKWFVNAFVNTASVFPMMDGTYEALGPAFNGNAHGLDENILRLHGMDFLRNCPRHFDGIMEYLSMNPIEGIVFWKDGEPKCKIKRSDFGFVWPVEIKHG